MSFGVLLRKDRLHLQRLGTGSIALANFLNTLPCDGAYVQPLSTENDLPQLPDRIIRNSRKSWKVVSISKSKWAWRYTPPLPTKTSMTKIQSTTSTTPNCGSSLVRDLFLLTYKCANHMVSTGSIYGVCTKSTHNTWGLSLGCGFRVNDLLSLLCSSTARRQRWKDSLALPYSKRFASGCKLRKKRTPKWLSCYDLLTTTHTPRRSGSQLVEGCGKRKWRDWSLVRYWDYIGECWIQNDHGCSQRFLTPYRCSCWIKLKIVPLNWKKY